MSERLKTGLIIVGIYILICLYLLFASYRVEKLDNDFYVEKTNTAVKLSK